MNIKNTTIAFLLLLSIPLFSQEIAENKGIVVLENNLSYLDSIKKTFVTDEMASCVDSLWMKELTNLDLYNDLSNEIENINIDEKVDYELPTELLKSRLEAMNAKSPFRIEYNESLENVIRSFLKYRKKSFERLMAISDYYFPMFEEAFALKNVPLEIKYLAVVESALNPRAISRVGATGLWQFMYQTGKQYNLKIDSYIDERSDPLKATAAAAQYMSNMFAIFGDWELVLASYNSGPGNVSKAIRRSGGKQNYWNIRKHLPKETQGYVPAFLATMYLYEYHNEHGIKPDKAIVQRFETDTIMMKKQMSFKQVSDLLDIPVSQLQLLNPSYKLNVIPAYKDEKHSLRLPKDKIALFTSNEDKIYAYAQYQLDGREKPFQASRAIASKKEDTDGSPDKITLTKTNYYKVKRGDNLGSIADKYNVAVSDLKKWNKLRGNSISYGKSLKIISTQIMVKSAKKEPEIAPVSKETIVENQRIASTKSSIKKEVKSDSLMSYTNSFYIVQKGDNLNAIAEKNKVSVANLIEWNHLSGSTIQQGKTLQIAANIEDTKEVVANSTLAAAEVEPAELKDINYTVLKGDNLSSISRKFGTAIADLKIWNNISNQNIVVGTSLIVAKNQVAITTDNATANSFKKSADFSKAANARIDYYVKKGDSLYSISKKYPGVTVSDLKKWNDIRGEGIKPGMKLKISG